MPSLSKKPETLVIEAGPPRRTSAADLDLVRRVLAGDRQAEQEFYTSYGRWMQYVVAGVLCRYAPGGRDPRQEAEDLLHDVLCELLGNGFYWLRTWDPDKGRSLRSYLACFAEYRAAAILRTRTRSPFTESPTDFAAQEEAPPEGDDIEDRLSDQRLARQVLAGLGAELKGDLDRRLFVAFFIDEVPIPLLKKHTGLSEEALYARKSRLKKVLRRALDKRNAGPQ